ncbi:MAG TPA: AI-2E family transporter [Candidatus Dormibacteraeota bacterium]|nr:AI-2E family transporter [Candidatus Dormibacteraeota bacterium]
MARPNQYRDISNLLAVVVAVVVIATLYLARVVLVPFALAMLATFLLTPVVIWLERIRMPRVFAVLLVVVLSVAAMGSVGWVVTDQFVNVTSKLPKYRANIKKKIESLHSPKGQSLNKATDDIAELGKELATAPTSGPAAGISGASESPPQTRPLRVQVVSPPTNLLESAGKLLGLLGTLGMVIIFTIFMLVRREDLRNRFIRLAGRGRLNLMTQALDEAAHRVSRYVFLQFIVNSCYGLLVGVALYFIGVPNALLWGVGAGLLRFLPYIGPPIGALLPILLSFAVFDGWGKSLIIIGLFVVLEVVVSSFVEPRLYGAHTGISALAILFAAIFWVLLWGPIGLILSTPLTVCLVVIGRHVPHLEFLQVILGDQPVLPPEAQFYQRLLATDQNEARQVLDRYLKDKSLEDLYDLVLIPALSLVEQDRHQNQLDEATQTFVFQSVKEVLEEIEDRSNEPRELNAKGAEVTDSDGTSPLSSQNAAAKRAISVVCMPVRDEADEIVGSILVHLLKKSGYRARYLDIGTTTEMLAQVMEEKPAIVFLSALPPFAVAHARRLYQALRAQTPDLKILIGLWHFSGDAEQAARRISGVSDGHISATLAHAMQQIRFLTAAAPRPAAESVIQTV